jgi:hypothetical protein
LKQQDASIVAAVPSFGPLMVCDCVIINADARPGASKRKAEPHEVRNGETDDTGQDSGNAVSPRARAAVLRRKSHGLAARWRHP